MSIGGTLSPTRAIAAAGGFSGRGLGGGRDRGRSGDGAPAMSTTASKPRVALIDQMAAEWESLGRSAAAVRSLRTVAPSDPVLSRLILGTADDPPPCPTPCDLVEHMRNASG